MKNPERNNHESILAAFNKGYQQYKAEIDEREDVEIVQDLRQAGLEYPDEFRSGSRMPSYSDVQTLAIGFIEFSLAAEGTFGNFKESYQNMDEETARIYGIDAASYSEVIKRARQILPQEVIDMARSDNFPELYPPESDK